MGINMAISSTAMGHQTTSKVISHMISALCLKKFTPSVLLVHAAHYRTFGLAVGKSKSEGLCN